MSSFPFGGPVASWQVRSAAVSFREENTMGLHGTCYWKNKLPNQNDKWQGYKMNQNEGIPQMHFLKKEIKRVFFLFVLEMNLINLSDRLSSPLNLSRTQRVSLTSCWTSQPRRCRSSWPSCKQQSPLQSRVAKAEHSTAGIRDNIDAFNFDIHNVWYTM